MAPTNKAKGKPNDLLCCRACLATEGKLINMRENKLVGEFFRVTGITVKEKDKLPQHLCVWCAALMHRCAAFRAKCLRVNQCILQIKGELNMVSIRTIDRFANQLVDLTQDEIEVDYVGQDMPANDNDNENNELDPADNVSSGKKELYIQINTLDNNEIKINVVHENDVKDALKNDSNDMSDVEYLDDNYETSFKIENENIEPIKYTTEDTDINKSKRNRNASAFQRYVKIKQQSRSKDTAKKYVRKRQIVHRTAENDYMPTVDLEGFKKTYNVDIVIQTQEEQIAEIVARRATAEYQAAPYPCEPCGRHFRDLDAYNHHRAKHDEKKGPFECPICQRRFRRKCLRMVHYDQHRFKYVCRGCGFVSRSRSQAKLHHAWHDGKVYRCPHCEMEFSKQSTYLGHVRRVHKVLNVACDMCGETFVNHAGMRMHRAYVHGAASRKQSLYCATCEVTFISLDALERHKMAAGKHDKMCACAQCGACFESEDMLREHVGEDHPSCQECNCTFLNVESYNVHVDRKHRGVGDPVTAKRRAANRRARALGLPPPYPPPKGKQYRYSQRVCCDHCGRMFQNMTLLRCHMKQLRGEQLPHACVHCPKSFPSRQQLENHMRAHTGEKPFGCALCGHAFTLKSNLRRHVESVHMGKKSECCICGRLLASPFAVKLHIRTVHNGEPWPKRAPKKRKPQPKLSAMSPQSSSSELLQEK